MLETACHYITFISPVSIFYVGLTRLYSAPTNLGIIYMKKESNNIDRNSTTQKSLTIIY